MEYLLEQLTDLFEDYEEMHHTGDKLEALKEGIALLLNEAGDLLRDGENEGTWDRAKGYWWAHITTALDNNHSFLGGSMVTMEDTIEELREAEQND